MNSIEALTKIVDELEHRIAELEGNRLDKGKLKAYIDTKMGVSKKVKKDYTDSFERVYQEYPKHEAKDEANKAYKKIDHSVWTDDMLIESFRNHRAEWRKHGTQFIPCLGPYLNKGRYKDEIKSFASTKAVRSRCHACGGIQTDDRKNDMFCFDCDFKERQKQ